MVLDLGIGILDFLARNYYDVVKDKLLIHSDREIFEGAFLRKYSSASEDANRNKGLPSIRKAFNDRCVEKLNVLANNVCLDLLVRNKARNSQMIRIKYLKSRDERVYRFN